MAVIMLNFAQILNKVDIVDSDIKYSDNEGISSWAIEGVKYHQETKIIRGRSDGNFAPKENATREK